MPYQPPSKPQRNAFNVEDQFVPHARAIFLPHPAPHYSRPYPDSSWVMPDTHQQQQFLPARQQTCYDPPGPIKHVGFPAYEAMPARQPSFWDPPGQHGYPTYEQPSLNGWPTPPVTISPPFNPNINGEEEEVVQKLVRLAVNHNVQMLSGEMNGESEISNNELFAGVDATEHMEDKDTVEVFSAEKEDITIGERELGSTHEEETTIDFTVEVKPKEEICDDTEYLVMKRWWCCQ